MVHVLRNENKIEKISLKIHPAFDVGFGWLSLA